MFNYVLSPEKKLPIYQPSMVKFQLVDSTVQHVKRFHKIVDFELTNQALSAGGTYNIQTSGAGNPALIGIDLIANNFITVTRDTTNDRIVISNTSGGSQSFSAKIFRFQ